MATQDISSLVKFCDIETGLKILNSQSLRWSSPHLFNDPFELSHKTKPKFTTEILLRGMIKEAISMLFGPTEPRGKSNRLVAAISRWRDEERFASEDEASEVLKQLLNQVAQQQQQSAEEYFKKWVSYARNIRICCFSDKPANLQAWERFASNHSGIAIRFSCGEDTSLPAPQKMRYSSTPPVISDLKEQIKVCFGQQEAASIEDFPNKLLTKNKENNMEREWRCIEPESNQSSNNDDEQLLYSNKKFSTPELKAIYLGLATAPSDKEAIIKLVKQKYKKTKLYQAEALPGRYEIEFSSSIGT